jgi:hypothetical protein
MMRSAEDDRLLLAAVAVDGVDHPGDVLLGHFRLQMSNGTLTLRGSSSPMIMRPGVVS